MQLRRQNGQTKGIIINYNRLQWIFVNNKFELEIRMKINELEI